MPNKTVRRTLIVLGAALFAAPLFLPRFYVYLLSLILINGLLATSLNMVLGYGGMYQFHHAVFYGIGAYTVALVITKTGLPAWVGFVAAPLMAALFSLIIGIICIRLTKLYFGMLQISLGSLVWTVVYRWYAFTGGDDGIHGITLPAAIGSTRGAFWFTLTLTSVSLVMIYKILHAPFGKASEAIRDNPERGQAIGIDIRRHQLTGLVLAGFFAGVAGSLFVVVEGSVFPDLMFWTLSLEILIMCLLGGWFTFFGPMLGAAIIVVLRTFVGIYTDYWTLVLGIVLMVLILALPQGVLGWFLEKLSAETSAAPVESESC
jgi:branched-chain amino acid transport system permease protein